MSAATAQPEVVAGDTAGRHVLRATGMVMFSACCFGSIPVIITLATRSGARLFDLLAWRYLVASVLLVAVSGGWRAVRSVGVGKDMRAMLPRHEGGRATARVTPEARGVNMRSGYLALDIRWEGASNDVCRRPPKARSRARSGTALQRSRGLQ